MGMTQKKKKHYIIKSHKSHNWIIAIMIIIMFYMGYQLYIKISALDSIPEENFRMLTVGLLFTLNLILMILVILIASFYIEVKDKFIEE